MAKHTYDILVNKSGDRFGSGTRVRVDAETEFEAMRLAKERVPGGRDQQIADIKLIK